MVTNLSNIPNLVTGRASSSFDTIFYSCHPQLCQADRLMPSVFSFPVKVSAEGILFFAAQSE